ncbi:unnamed protein product [Litomosoides sigmodontis]|uniref:aECM cysteine-cradle domain-containing protein n=1 Tax=Litomosoides sigmodontis TaxID=42156 RepID=A0A3P7K167_LITSI|nr:unnamed protein product [Litomosoides sigmodontis]
MFTKIIVLLSLQRTVIAEEKPFLDLKKVIRGALDVVAAVPTSPTANYDASDVSQTTVPGAIQGIDPVFREKLSKLFHIPPDLFHRLAAQAGFIDYEPTTAKPFSPYRYYQPFGPLPQNGQPKMIIYGGQLYMATPLQSETHAQKVTANVRMAVPNRSKAIDQNRRSAKRTDRSNEEANDEMHYRHFYPQKMTSAGNDDVVQVQRAQLQQTFKQYDEGEEADNSATDREGIEEAEEQTMRSVKEIVKFLPATATAILSREMVGKDDSIKFAVENEKMKRILALRRKMANDRKKFAERKRLLSSMKRSAKKDSDMNEEIFRRHCYKIRSLARQFGSADVKQYVVSNCALIESYYPEFKCEKAEVAVEKCKRLF